MDFLAIIKQRVMGLSVNNKIVLAMRIGILGISALLAFDGRPPAHAQRSVVPVISSEDAQQDIQLSKAQEWHTNQESWNHDTGLAMLELRKRIDDVEKETSSIDSKINGGFGMLTFLSGLAIFFQLKKKAG